MSNSFNLISPAVQLVTMEKCPTGVYLMPTLVLSHFSLEVLPLMPSAAFPVTSTLVLSDLR